VLHGADVDRTALAPRRAVEVEGSGYAAGFRDLDGHAWAVAYNPGFGLTADGSVNISG
jgi:uncharacterized protein